MSQALPYRPDIDTLRAAAVLSVIVFHIEKNWLPGGFLGVDIFFVISGFLMTMILHREMSGGGGGGFPWRNFYLRRISGVLPAFFPFLGAGRQGAFFFFTTDDFFFFVFFFWGDISPPRGGGGGGGGEVSTEDILYPPH
nr:hypothetical protein [Neisseria lactamica]